MKTRTILEFNEEQQIFHYNSVVNNVPKDQEDRLGWKTLIICEDDNEASVFADFLQVQFLSRGVAAKFDELEYTMNNLIRFNYRFKELKNK